MHFMRNVFDFIVIQPTYLSKLACQLIFKRTLTHNGVNLASRSKYRMPPKVFRQEKSYTAVVQQIFNASPSIKMMQLHVKEAGFSFKAGQWVDFQVPGIDEVTGYSMTSPPFEAIQNSTLDLAVKEGSFPTTYWVHSKCQKGDEVNIKVGGDFYYDPKPDTPEATADLLLIGGGVGINPLVSIFLEYCHLVKQNRKNNSSISPGKVHLLYSTKTEKELIFKQEFVSMEKEHPSITCQYFITGNQSNSSSLETKRRRIQISDIKESIDVLQRKHTLCYICGPSNMTDDMASILTSLQVPDSYIRYEKWW